MLTTTNDVGSATRGDQGLPDHRALHISRVRHVQAHTHDERDEQGTDQGGLGVLDLVRCRVKTKTCPNTGLGYLPGLCLKGRGGDWGSPTAVAELSQGM